VIAKRSLSGITVWNGRWLVSSRETASGLGA
jgi:hypothetical protein